MTDRTKWRNIECGAVDWFTTGISARAAHRIKDLCNMRFADSQREHPRKEYDRLGLWADMTLGELADRGERWWRMSAEYGVGPMAIDVIKRTIDAAAEGRDVLIKQARDSYVPKCERGDG